MYQGRLWVVKLGRNVTRHPKVRILINGARYAAWDVLLASEDERKGGTKRRSRFKCRKGDLSNAVRIAKAEDSLHLIERDTSLNFDHIIIELGALTVRRYMKDSVIAALVFCC